MTIGEDRKVLLWNIDDCKLMGACQRVELDRPPEHWEMLFNKDIKPCDLLGLQNYTALKVTQGKNTQ